MVIGTWAVSAVGSANQAYGQEPTPISHVVIFFQENHSFDNVLGVECRKRATLCDGAVSGKLSSGKTIKLAEGPEVVPQVDHTTAGQLTAMNDGKMNGFDKISGCTKTDNYRCYSLYGTKQVPNIAALASTFAVSDRTFESATVPSYGAHLELATTTLDGFTGANGLLDATGPGWGMRLWWPAPMERSERICLRALKYPGTRGESGGIGRTSGRPGFACQMGADDHGPARRRRSLLGHLRSRIH